MVRLPCSQRPHTRKVPGDPLLCASCDGSWCAQWNPHQLPRKRNRTSKLAWSLESLDDRSEPGTSVLPREKETGKLCGNIDQPYFSLAMRIFVEGREQEACGGNVRKVGRSCGNRMRSGKVSCAKPPQNRCAERNGSSQKCLVLYSDPPRLRSYKSTFHPSSSLKNCPTIGNMPVPGTLPDCPRLPFFSTHIISPGVRSFLK